MENWKTYMALEFCLNVTDGTHDSPKPKSVGHYLITSKHLQNNTIDFSSAYRISEEDYLKIIKRSAVVQHDILFSMIGTIGNTVRVKEAEVDYAVKNMAIFKMGGNQLRSKWMYYWLKSNKAKKYIASRLAGSTQSYLTLDSLRKFPISAPSEDEMNKIVSLLSSLDDKIELNRRINDNLEQQAQALFKSWFVDFEPFKDGEFVDSELGMIPKGWEIGTIEDLCQNIASGSTPSSMNQEYYNGQIKWFTTKELKDSFLIDSEKHISDEGHNNSSTKMFPRGTVLMAIYAAPTVGRLGILTSDATFNQAAVGLNPKQEIGSNYVFLLLKKERDSFNNLAIGAAQQNLSVKFVKTYPTIIPSKKVFVDFNVLVKPLFDRISLLSIEIETMTKTRDTLLPKLMSGELKIGRV